MKSWTELRRVRFCLTTAKSLAEGYHDAHDKRHQQSLIIENVCPLVGQITRKKFNWLHEDEQDDLCSEVLLRVSRKICGYRPGRIAEMPEKVYMATLRTMISREVIDYLRMHHKSVPKYYNPSSIRKSPRLSVPKTVDIKMVFEEMPSHITNFTVRHDRFGYGRLAIRATVTLLLQEKHVPTEMLSNWFGVKNPKHCVRFVTLMTRWFLHKYRDKFGSILEGTICESIEEGGLHVRTLV